MQDLCGPASVKILGNSAVVNQHPGVMFDVIAQDQTAMNRQTGDIARAQGSIDLDPDYLCTHIVLAIAFAEMDRFETALAAIESISGIEQSVSLDVIAGTEPILDANVMKRHLKRLRRAGLPG